MGSQPTLRFQPEEGKLYTVLFMDAGLPTAHLFAYTGHNEGALFFHWCLGPVIIIVFFFFFFVFFFFFARRQPQQLGKEQRRRKAAFSSGGQELVLKLRWTSKRILNLEGFGSSHAKVCRAVARTGAAGMRGGVSDIRYRAM